ncbi:hypothetical protein M0R45_016215 [Rubus argutus]|uniref:NAD(P)-binding domain-containing protein n=1 Tax=Rubus argutus TaxID=59490 RepID=A0AAW1XT90_RUBAR
MAFRLSLSSSPNFHILAPRKIPTCSLPPLGFQLKYSSNSRPAISCSKGALDAVQEEVVQSPASDSTSGPSSSSKLVLVIGGTGGVGQLIVASLLNRNVKSRLLLRDTEKATALFGEQDEEKLQVFKGDTRNPGDLDPSIFEVCAFS